MSNNIIITQKSAVGSDTTQVGTQNNYYGLTPAEASEVALNLFKKNFPILQEEAMKTVRERVDELIGKIISQIENKYAGNYSSFTKPDMQYILAEAEKGYARKGTPELCSILSSLIADRSACVEYGYLEMVLDKAIEIAPSLLPKQLDYLSLIFLYKHIKFNSISTLEDLQNQYNKIHKCFLAPQDMRYISYLDMLGLLTIELGDGSEILSKAYGFDRKDVKNYLPSEQTIIPGDYGLTPVGIILAIFNTNSKTDLKLDLSIWIHE